MAQLQGFPSCCGAQILTGLYGREDAVDPLYQATGMPPVENFHYFTMAITNQTQHNDKTVVKALRERGFEPVVTFTGNGDTQLHLWARGRNWKPLAGAKGNMKPKMECLCGPEDAMSEAVPCNFCKAVAKEINRREKIKLKPFKVSRQPAGKKSQARRSTHGRGTSRTETSA